MPPNRPVLVCSIAAVAFAAAVWLADSFLAPHLFTRLWVWPQTWMAPFMFALLVPLVVAIPTGYSFGLLAWSRALAPALAVTSIAAALELVTFMGAGGLGVGRAWVFLLEAVALVVAFGAAAALAGRMVANWSPTRRNRVGASAFAVTVAAIGGFAYLGFRALVG